LVGLAGAAVSVGVAPGVDGRSVAGRSDGLAGGALAVRLRVGRELKVDSAVDAGWLVVVGPAQAATMSVIVSALKTRGVAMRKRLPATYC